MDASPAGDKRLSVEVFAAKDTGVAPSDLMLAVPPRCGLKNADTLRVSGLRVVAMRGKTVLSVDLPDLSPDSRAKFLALAESGRRLAVAEFMPLGLFDAYFLDVDFAS